MSAEAIPDDDEPYVKRVVHKSESVKEQLFAALRKNPLFENHDAMLLDEIVDSMDKHSCESGEVVITQGEPGDNFYVVGAGKFAAQVAGADSDTVAEYATGDSFGELALLYNSPRAATVRCQEVGALWGLGRVAFRKLVISQTLAVMHNLEHDLEKVPILSKLDIEQRTRLAAAMTIHAYRDGDYILKVGDVADALFLILTGKVVCHRADGSELMRLEQGQFFGESALNAEEGAERLANVAALGNARCARLKAADFQHLLGSLQEALNDNFNHKVLSGIALFESLHAGQRGELQRNLVEKTYEDGEKIVKQGEMGINFYIVKAGSVKVMQQSEGHEGEAAAELDTLSSGAYFGERALLRRERCAATIVADGRVQLMTLDKDKFETVLGPLQELIDAQIRRRDAAARFAGKLSLSDLKQVGPLGEGTFSKVQLVQHIPTKEPYALKVMSKGRLTFHRKIEQVMNEKRVLEMCDHAFVLKLAATLNSRTDVFMLFEPALGGELFTLLHAKGTFGEGTAQMYTAMVTSAFNYLHARKIAHRDLKPENLLVMSDGYLKLIDFGFAKMIKDYTTWTLCGTPEYLAPEVINNQGHNLGCDWWTLGVLLYEMLLGSTPFAGKTQLETYHKIMRGKIKFPATMTAPAKEVITKLLTREPANRIGCWRRGAKDVMAQTFFDDIDFKKLEAREIRAPLVPRIHHTLDLSNFDHVRPPSPPARAPPRVSPHARARWQSEALRDRNEDMNQYLDPAYESMWESEFGPCEV